MPRVTLTKEGDICVLTLDDGKVNALGPSTQAEIHAALDTAENEAKAVVLVGRPDRFSAGFDLGVMKEGAESAAAMVAGGGELLLRLFSFPLPVVVGCTGHALAAGAIVLLTSDYRVGARGAYQLGLNETAIGMTLPQYGVEFARARMSKRYFDRSVAHGEIFDPEAAKDAGYLDDIVAPESVVSTALAVATRLAELPQPAFGMNKRIAHASTIELLDGQIDKDVRRLFGL